MESESILAKKFVTYFESCGYDVYKEVAYCGGRIDIVATDGHIRIACEVKNSANLHVLAQAVHAHSRCHYSYIGIPKVSHTFYRQVCDKFGIGILETNAIWDGSVWESERPLMNRRVLPLKLENYMKESVAGGLSGEQMTPFKVTVRDIVRYVEKHPNSKFSDVLKEVPTHYHSISTAKSSIRKWINSGVIKEFTINKGVVELVPVKIKDVQTTSSAG